MYRGAVVDSSLCQISIVKNNKNILFSFRITFYKKKERKHNSVFVFIYLFIYLFLLFFFDYFVYVFVFRSFTISSFRPHFVRLKRSGLKT